MGLLERGLAPVPWNKPASLPRWDFTGPILPLHWGNLLHPDPGQNNNIIDGWAELLLAETARPELVMAENFDICWRQASVFYFGKLVNDGMSIIIDLRSRPENMPCRNGTFYIKVRKKHSGPLRVKGAEIVSGQSDEAKIRTVKLRPINGIKRIQILLPQ